MRENDKNVLLIVCDFRNEVRGTHLVFSKEEISRFHVRNFESGRSLGRKVHFVSTPLGQPTYPGVSDFLFIVMLSF